MSLFSFPIRSSPRVPRVEGGGRAPARRVKQVVVGSGGDAGRRLLRACRRLRRHPSDATSPADHAPAPLHLPPYVREGHPYIYHHMFFFMPVFCAYVFVWVSCK
jgi:hypothetical protein